MFDPFGDFEEKGYLRNKMGLKDPVRIKKFEHMSFNINLFRAIENLAACDDITYSDVLKTHEILFSKVYPWAGKDRKEVAPGLSISKGSAASEGYAIFANPEDIKMNIEYGIHLSGNLEKFKKSPGEVMGLFAFGHPFLDGNGRTILLVHSELCYRAGFSVNWPLTKKSDYLLALSKEIDDPRGRHLDAYLKDFLIPSQDRGEWLDILGSIDGLDGLDSAQVVAGDVENPEVKAAYENQARYTLMHATSSKDCQVCRRKHCSCVTLDR